MLSAALKGMTTSSALPATDDTFSAPRSSGWAVTMPIIVGLLVLVLLLVSMPSFP
jgi:hypothetical protein